MPRSKVRKVSEPNAIVPVASPVDAYVRPAEPARSPLHDLAKGLAVADSGISGFLNKRQTKQNEADRIRGEAAFNANNQVGWAEGVRSGAVPPNASPFFMEGFKSQQGNLLGLQLKDKFRHAWVNWEGRNDDDPEVFQNFLQEFLKENIKTTDVDILRGLNPHVEALIEGGYTQFSKERANAAYSESIRTSSAVTRGIIDMASEDGLESEEGTDYAGLWDTLVAIREADIARGTRREDVDKQFVADIIAKAIEHEDPQLLQLLDKTLPGDDSPLSSFPDFGDAKQQAIEKLEAKARQRVTEDYKRQKRIDKAAEEAIVRDISRAIAKDPTAEISEAVIRSLEKYDPMARKKIADIRKALMDGGVREDPRALLELYEELRQGGNESDINQAVLDGIIKSPETYNRALDRLDKYNKARGAGETGILKSRGAKRYEKLFLQKLGDSTDGLSIWGGAQHSEEFLEAMHDFDLMLLEWEEKNPDATLSEREDAITKLGNQILHRIDDDLRTYYSNQEARDETSIERIQSLDDEWKQRLYGSHEPPSLDELPEELRDFIMSRAKRLGVTPEAINYDIWLGAQKRLPSRTNPDKQPRLESPEAAESRQPVPRVIEPAQPEALPEPSLSQPQAEEPDREPHPFAGDTPPKLEDLPEASQERIKNLSEKLKVPVEEVNEMIWKRMKKLIHKGTRDESGDPVPGVDPTTTESIPKPEKTSLSGGGELPFTSDAVDEATKKAFNEAALREAQGIPSDANIQSASIDGDAGTLLNVIGITEGTDKGRGYNETLGYGAYTGGDVELTSMTLGQIDRLQSQMLRHPKNRLNSSALGRYQIVRTTLRSLKKKLGLSNNEKFTPELQDRLAVELLKGRGLEKWQAGQMSDEEFMDSISKEWASLPTSKGGGYYDGQNAGISRERMLEGLRALTAQRGMSHEGHDHSNTASGNLDELLVRPDRGYDPDVDNVKASVKAKLKDVQRRFGKQIAIVSGYRSPTRNKKAGGARKSQHMHGNAVDIDVRDMSKAERIRLIRAATAAGFTGIGVYNNSLHFDIGKRRYWGPNYRAASLPAWAKSAINDHMGRTA